MRSANFRFDEKRGTHDESGMGSVLGSGNFREIDNTDSARQDWV